MLTVRIRPKIRVNPDATTNSSPAKVTPSSSVTTNSPGSRMAGPAEVLRARTKTHRAAAATGTHTAARATHPGSTNGRRS